MFDSHEAPSLLDRIDAPGLTVKRANQLLEEAHRSGDPGRVYPAIVRLAQIHFRHGHYKQTQQLLAEVLQNAPQEATARCDALRILGNCAAELGEPKQAESYYYQAVDLARQLDDRFTIYKCLHSLATNIYWQRGQFDLVLSAGQEALEQARALGLTEDLWFPLSDLAWVYWVTGQIDRASRIADQMEQCVTPGSLGQGFYCCLRAGLVQPASDFLDTALPLYRTARSIAEATGDPGLNVEARIGLCRGYRLAGNLPCALAWAEEAVEGVERDHYRQFMPVAYLERARTAMQAGNLEQAVSDLETCLQLSAPLQAHFDLARANLYLAAVLFSQESPRAASAWAEAARLIRTYGYGFLLQQERGLVLPLLSAHLDAEEAALAQTSKSFFEQFMQATPAAIQVKMLGQFSVWVGANSIAKDALRQRRAGELLALLLTRPDRSLTYPQVSEALCPEKSPEAALDFYHHAISALRRLLEPELPDRRFNSRYLEVDNEQIRFILPPGSQVDLLEFEACIQEQAWERAVAVYAGEFLPTLRYAEWANPLRQYLADQHERALIALAEICLASGDFSRGLNLARQVLLHNPWHEQAAGLGMRAALALGDRATAIRLYLRLEKVLHKDLGISPQREILDLFALAQRRPARK